MRDLEITKSLLMMHCAMVQIKTSGIEKEKGENNIPIVLRTSMTQLAKEREMESFRDRAANASWFLQKIQTLVMRSAGVFETRNMLIEQVATPALAASRFMLTFLVDSRP